jgi:CheY-like chemotaxis protein
MRPLVMVIEDDPDNLDSIVELLHDEGYDVLSARTGEEAAQRLEGNAPCLIICDYLLPDTTGSTLVKRLGAQAGGRKLPVVFLTAALDPIDTQGAPVVKKPVALQDLLAVLQSFCGPHALPR